MNNWMNDTYRKLHLDNHQPEWMGGVAAAITEEEAKRQATMLKEAGVQAVEVFAYDHYGHTFYPSDIAVTHPHLENDYTGRMVRALKEAGIRTILYMNVFSSVHMRRLHPEWLRVAEDGTFPRGAWLSQDASHICISSDFLERFYIPLVQEAVSKHQPDAVWFDGGSWLVEQPCYCENCRKLYREQLGADLPKGPMPEPDRELDSPEWVQWRLWRRGMIAPYIAQVTSAVKALSPDTLVADNNSGKYFMGFPLTEKGRFVRWLTPRELGVDWLSCDPVHFGANHEVIFSREGRYQSTTGLPFDYMNERFHGWGEWQMRSPTDWKLEMATKLAVGAKCFFADNPYVDGSLEPAVYKDLKDVYAFVQERETYSRGTQAVPEVAILASLPSQLLGPTAGAEWGRDSGWGEVSRARPDRVDGASMLLTEAGIQHLIYDEATLREQLHRQALVIVADQCLMEAETISALERYVADGGRVIVTGRSGLWSESGERRADDLFAALLGVKRTGVQPAPIHYWEAEGRLRSSMPYGEVKLQVWGEAMQLETGDDVETLAELIAPNEHVWRPGGGRARADWQNYTTVGAAPAGDRAVAPSITARNYGLGRVIYMNGEPFALYYLEGHRLTREWLFACLEDLYPSSKRMLSARKPYHVELAVHERRNGRTHELFVHVLNYFAQKRSGYLIHNEQIPPIDDIELTIRPPCKPSAIFLQPEGADLEWTWDGERATISLPRLQLHSIVQIVVEDDNASSEAK
ncbi:alpha-L-fucosidase [Cohnella terricola]|uniref:Beta-galactosidase trimerisation domain-containing protein n=1 Tax=Cohnella terricola TaxID=1289167 RepID=A0A559JQM7_9BACL|nr:alpha-L-fucosidase [Cohnella terricola]TVY02185.1 hypothetical protein FPZ45_07020 [Cohnella terricola]